MAVVGRRGEGLLTDNGQVDFRVSSWTVPEINPAPVNPGVGWTQVINHEFGRPRVDVHQSAFPEGVGIRPGFRLIESSAPYVDRVDRFTVVSIVVPEDHEENVVPRGRRYFAG